MLTEKQASIAAHTHHQSAEQQEPPRGGKEERKEWKTATGGEQAQIGKANGCVLFPWGFCQKIKQKTPL